MCKNIAERREGTLNTDDIYELEKLVWFEIQRHLDKVATLEKSTLATRTELLQKELADIERLNQLHNKVKTLANGGI